MNGFARRRLQELQHDHEIREVYDSIMAEAPDGEGQDHFNQLLLGLLIDHNDEHRRRRYGVHTISGFLGALVVGVASNLDRLR